jgi:hypothetical protein
MKIVKLYLLGIFLMIALLSASTFFQYLQFQNNIKKISFDLPTTITNAPDFNNEYGKLIEQAQKKTQEQINIQNSNATTTNEYLPPDKSFSFIYRADWQTTSQPIVGTNGKTLLSIYKINGLSLLASSFLIVKESSASNEKDAIEQYKNDIWEKNVETKIAEYKINNKSQEAIQILEFKTNTAAADQQTIESTEKTAFIAANGKIYLISTTIIQNNINSAQEIDDIFKSISIAKQETIQTINP